MTFTFAPDADEARFRAEIAEFIKERLPADMVRRTKDAVHYSREDMLTWTAILAEKGWSVPHWPVEYGGTGWSERYRGIFGEMIFAAGAPANNMQAISLVGPVIYTFGTEEQKKRFLPDIREGKVFWAQGFSEPNSGSDLASLRTTAILDGDEYVINGQKIWTSQAFMADWIFLLVRTNPNAADKRSGISFMLVPADTPGITIRPIVSIDGGTSLCETFLENVRVPKDSLVGEEGKGWVYANFLLGNERTTTAEVPRNKRMLARAIELAHSHKRGGRPLIEDPAFASRLSQLASEVAALEVSVHRVLTDTAGNQGRPTASTLKLRGVEILQGLLELQVEALGARGAIAMPAEAGESDPVLLALAGLEDGEHVTTEYLFRRAATIYGGTSEIQRTIIAKSILKIGDTSAPSGHLTDDQRMLADSVSRFVERAYPFEARNALLEEGKTAIERNWQAYGEAGWTAMGVPEEAGGLGSTPGDIAVVLEGLGGALALEPLLSSGVMGARALAAAGGQKADELLAASAEGVSVLALAHDEPDAAEISDVNTTAQKTDSGFVLNGSKMMVLGAPLADVFLVSAVADGNAVSLFAVPKATPGLSITEYRLFDGRLAGDINLANVAIDADALVGAEGGALEAIVSAYEHGAIGLCAEAVGAMEKAFWITRDYTKTRQQFNTAIADFQAVQHHLANMYVELEQARSMLARGVAALELEKADERSVAVSASKALIGHSARKVAAIAVQLHGGIGVTEEYVIGHYFKRLMVSDQLLGDRYVHQSKVAKSLARTTAE